MKLFREKDKVKMVVFFTATFPFHSFVCGTDYMTGCTSQIVQRKYTSCGVKTGKVLV